MHVLCNYGYGVFKLLHPLLYMCGIVGTLLLCFADGRERKQQKN